MRTTAKAPSSPIAAGMPLSPTGRRRAAGELVLEALHDLGLGPVGDDVGPPQLPGGEEQQQHPERHEQLAGPADDAARAHEAGTSACSGTIEPL